MIEYAIASVGRDHDDCEMLFNSQAIQWHLKACLHPRIMKTALLRVGVFAVHGLP
jgi:hypothetical protein